METRLKSVALYPRVFNPPPCIHEGDVKTRKCGQLTPRSICVKGFSQIPLISLTRDDVVVSVLSLVVLQVGEVGCEVLLRRHGLDGLVLLAEADVAVGVEGGDVPDEEVGRNGRLGEARAAARVAASEGGGRGRGALNVPVGYDGRRLGKMIC